MIYYKLSTCLQFISSELGVWFLQTDERAGLSGRQHHRSGRAETACGRSLFGPALPVPDPVSFSYIFAVLYKGPMWHKAVLLISAAPITVLMNSVRIAIGGRHRATITASNGSKGLRISSKAG